MSSLEEYLDHDMCVSTLQGYNISKYASEEFGHLREIELSVTAALIFYAYFGVCSANNSCAYLLEGEEEVIDQ